MKKLYKSTVYQEKTLKMTVVSKFGQGICLPALPLITPLHSQYLLHDKRALNHPKEGTYFCISKAKEFSNNFLDTIS